MLFPVLLVMLMLVVQFALAAHARHLVTAAAQDASVAARRNGATDADGEATAREVLGSGELLDHVTVAVEGDGNDVQVVITASVDSVVPGFPAMQVRGEAAGPRERFRP